MTVMMLILLVQACISIPGARSFAVSSAATSSFSRIRLLSSAPDSSVQKAVGKSDTNSSTSSCDADSGRLARHTVSFQTTDQAESSLSFDAYGGETLRTAALRRNIASPHNGRANLINCRGLGTCGTCAVEIVEGIVDPPERNDVEEFRLNLPPHNLHNNTKLRLACQIQIRENITVLKRTGFWGQKSKLAVPSTPQRYFGELEYLMDTKSPPLEECIDDNNNADGKTGPT
ncbi:Ferredoxin [Seminavis robusta]|uniref:Ferredoxin n=1 Tax=Seminavis robusta TaxID=568900 RepID=A0A9N8D6T7_9STRA|nr:Ferredoxin [Seminavis robusta]|eukprot:Sro20_g014260.1 Ferredoxin (231) ;mRNA; r:123101-123793